MAPEPIITINLDYWSPTPSSVAAGLYGGGNKEERRVITTTEQYAAHAHGELPSGFKTRDNHNGYIVPKEFSPTMSIRRMIKWVYNNNSSISNVDQNEEEF